LNLPFREVWLADFEFEALPGERPKPVCLVALELKSGRLVRQFQNEFHYLPSYPIDADALFVAYFASAELSCHLALGWPLPARVLDLYVEFRNHTNGIETACGAGLLGALAYFGLDGIDAVEKKEMQEAIGNGTWRGRYSPEEILDYCESDVRALARLLPAIAPQIDLPRALLRGRYMSAVARMESTGIPIDVPVLEQRRALDRHAGRTDRSHRR
jgi:DNA polymerase-1